MTEENKQERIRLEFTSDGQCIYLDCPVNHPLGKTYDAIIQFRAYVLNMMVKDHNENSSIEILKEEENDICQKN